MITALFIAFLFYWIVGGTICFLGMCLYYKILFGIDRNLGNIIFKFVYEKGEKSRWWNPIHSFIPSECYRVLDDRYGKFFWYGQNCFAGFLFPLAPLGFLIDLVTFRLLGKTQDIAVSFVDSLISRFEKDIINQHMESLEIRKVKIRNSENILSFLDPELEIEIILPEDYNDYRVGPIEQEKEAV